MPSPQSSHVCHLESAPQLGPCEPRPLPASTNGFSLSCLVLPVRSACPVLHRIGALVMAHGHEASQDPSSAGSGLVADTHRVCCHAVGLGVRRGQAEACSVAPTPSCTSPRPVHCSWWVSQVLVWLPLQSSFAHTLWAPFCPPCSRARPGGRTWEPAPELTCFTFLPFLPGP